MKALSYAMSRRRTELAVFFAALGFAGCDEGPSVSESGASKLDAAQKRGDCVTWCEIERGMACAPVPGRLADCDAYCSDVGACGEAGPVLVCREAHPDEFSCASHQAYAAPQCFAALDAYKDAVAICVGEKGDAPAKLPCGSNTGPPLQRGRPSFAAPHAPPSGSLSPVATCHPGLRRLPAPSLHPPE